jgi:hypothetical protein
MDSSLASTDFNKFLKSIGGLENGFFSGREPIMDRGFFQVSDGWLPLIQLLIEDLIKLGWDKQLCDSKEKFGGLRFYINSGSDEIHQRISQAERESYLTCEKCGEPGELRKDSGWWTTLCDTHHKH